MTGKNIILLLGLLALLPGRALAQGAEIIFSLVNTDKQFALALQEDGVRRAYLKFLDREGLVYRPEPVNGRDYYRKMTDDSTGLFRYPDWAEVTDDGLLGYTTGLFELRGHLLDEKPLSTGHYLSIWRRKSSKDNWEIILDIQVDQPPTMPLRSVNYNQDISGKVPITPALELVKSKEILLDSDELFNVSLKAGRLEFGFNEFYHDSVQVFRENYLPLFGKEKASEHLLQMKGKYTYTTGDAYLSLVRDIAYTFGRGYYYENIRTSRFDQHFSYVRIWRKDSKGLWKVILDMEKPYEPEVHTEITKSTTE